MFPIWEAENFVSEVGGQFVEVHLLVFLEIILLIMKVDGGGPEVFCALPRLAVSQTWESNKNVRHCLWARAEQSAGVWVVVETDHGRYPVIGVEVA